MKTFVPVWVFVFAASLHAQTDAVPVAGTDWKIQQSASNEPNASVVVLTLEPNAPITADGGSAHPTIVLRCRNGEFAAYLAAGMMLDATADGGTFVRMLSNTDSSARLQRWPTSTSRQSVFAPNAIDFMGILTKADTIRLAFVPKDANAIEASFTVAGLATPALRLAHSCPDVGLQRVVVNVPASDRPFEVSDSLDQPVSVISLAVRYPDAMINMNVEGEVELEFVVDTLGRVEPFSVRVLKAADLNGQFTRASIDALVGGQFRPAMKDGHKVRALVRQPFTYGLRHQTCVGATPSRCLTNSDEIRQQPPL